MSGQNNNRKFKCPHCNEIMDEDIIYLHVRKIFNCAKFKCSDCNFSSNDNFHADHHKKSTKHKLEKEDTAKIALLEEAMQAAATVFINSMSKKSGTTTNTATKRRTSSHQESAQSKKAPSPAPVSKYREVYSDKPNTSKKTTDDDDSTFLVSNADKKLIANTCFEINNMSFEYDRGNYNDKSQVTLQINMGKHGQSKIFKIPLPLYDPNNNVKCLKCDKPVHESYLARRKHIFREHLGELKESLLKIRMGIKKSDILFTGFKLIREYFPEQIVCTDFQCTQCGQYYKTIAGMKYHVGVAHQKNVLVACPFDGCDFESGSNIDTKYHVRTHLKGMGEGKGFVTVRNIVSFVTPEAFSKFNTECKIESEVSGNIVKHYFPISVKIYDSFEKDFKDTLDDFKKNFMQTHVLNDLPLKASVINEIDTAAEIEDSSDDESSSDDEKDFGFTGRRTNIILKPIQQKRITQRKSSSESDNDVVFLKEEVPGNAKLNAFNKEIPEVNPFSHRTTKVVPSIEVGSLSGSQNDINNSQKRDKEFSPKIEVESPKSNKTKNCSVGERTPSQSRRDERSKSTLDSSSSSQRRNYEGSRSRNYDGYRSRRSRSRSQQRSSNNYENKGKDYKYRGSSRYSDDYYKRY